MAWGKDRILYITGWRVAGKGAYIVAQDCTKHA